MAEPFIRRSGESEPRTRVQTFGGVLGPLSTREVGLVRGFIDRALKSDVSFSESQQKAVEDLDTYLEQIVDENTQIGFVK